MCLSCTRWRGSWSFSRCAVVIQEETFPFYLILLCFCQSLSTKVTVDDRGNGGKTLQGTNGSLSATILLVVEVAPINDAPTLTIPTAGEASSSAALLTAEEDRLGIVGAGRFGWTNENILGSTTISNASIVLADADVTYATGATTPQQPYSRWRIESSAVGLAPEANDTMTVTVTVSHGGILLSDARSEVTLLVLSRAAATTATSSEFAAELELSGPMWAVADALKGVLYRTDLNWNSWVGSGGSQLQPVVSEVSSQADHCEPCSLPHARTLHWWTLAPILVSTVAP